MRPIRWDDGTRFDDVNARWGDPSYVLEAGDPGYVIPPPVEGAFPKHKHKHKTMSSNATPKNQNVLTALARRILTGQIAHGASVGLTKHLPAAMEACIEKIDGDPGAAAGSAANKGSQLVYRECVGASQAAESAMVALSETTVKTWLEGYRKIIESVHGKSANAGWQAAGFEQGSTAVPRTHNARASLVTAARAYLAAHSTYETTLPHGPSDTLPITAARALQLQTDLTAAFALIDTRDAEQAACKATRDADQAALFDEVSMTIAELRDELEPDDVRWELFGLNIPANPNPPEAVASLELTAAGAGRVLFSWIYAVRAEYYRVFLKRVGVDAEFINVDDASDLEYIAKNLAPGSSIEGYVVPVNDGGEGPASPTVAFTLPA